MDRASDFGSEGWRFESVRAHKTLLRALSHDQDVKGNANGTRLEIL